MAGAKASGGSTAFLLLAAVVAAAWLIWSSAARWEDLQNARPVPHALEKHLEEAWNGPMALEALRNGACADRQSYWSDARASLLVLCRLRGNLWGGAIFRRGPKGWLLITAYAAHRERWDHIIQRDQYRPIALIP